MNVIMFTWIQNSRIGHYLEKNSCHIRRHALDKCDKYEIRSVWLGWSKTRLIFGVFSHICETRRGIWPPNPLPRPSRRKRNLRGVFRPLQKEIWDWPVHHNPSNPHIRFPTPSFSEFSVFKRCGVVSYFWFELGTSNFVRELDSGRTEVESKDP